MNASTENVLAKAALSGGSLEETVAALQSALLCVEGGEAKPADHIHQNEVDQHCYS